MLGVATLIIVMAVMNGFRNELLDKILGLNGHLLIQPLEKPLTDWNEVAARIAGRQRHKARRAHRRRPGARLLAVQCRRRADPRHPADGPAEAAVGRQEHQAGHARRLRRRAGRRDRAQARRPAFAARRRQHHAGGAARRGDADGHHAAHQGLQGRGGVRDRHVGIRQRHGVHAAEGSAGLFQPRRRRHRDRGLYRQSRPRRPIPQGGAGRRRSGRSS